MWDVTCPDTGAPPHLALAGLEAGSVVNQCGMSHAQIPALHLIWLRLVLRLAVWPLKLSITRGQNIMSWTQCTLAIETSGTFGPAAADLHFLIFFY